MWLHRNGGSLPADGVLEKIGGGGGAFGGRGHPAGELAQAALYNGLGRYEEALRAARPFLRVLDEVVTPMLTGPDGGRQKTIARSSWRAS